MDIAIITGSSSGLGREFARHIANRYQQLDEIWLIARRRERLKALASELASSTHAAFRVVPLDLADSSNYGGLGELLADAKPVIRVLVNNAGYEREGLLRDMEPDDMLAMIDLNVKGMTMINRTCLPYMSRGSFEIVTGSVSAFAPMPWQAVYGASKAYVRSLVFAIREEERRRGVNIMLLSPGNMDTEMNVRGSGGGKIGMLPYLNLARTVERSLSLAERGCGEYTPLMFYKAYRLAAKLVPATVMARFTRLDSGGTNGRGL
ncbi:SDR family NAD(P)-dependent oxidoreductase [Bifidobacterium felsineum]|uniref:NADP-dependent 3-hydroxy acid dehydrogenase YdfG n=1 Tax=Bifidobacterium felsineum TaxID=2045440 RepID=A0A2M9HKH8_9BIFI|nr:SDR family NAD(P)-dependent oxidoreductase [Bifidobacterium felsineum]PJM77319.1 short-chain dehydrogenase [Bifidobacterium felsineum]